MTYIVHEMHRTIQGEGANAGRVCVLCRFAGCNLWTGREQDRASAICRFCDTEFRGGTKYRSAGALATTIKATWGGPRRDAFVVFTGGEPTLQVDAELVEACHWAGFEVAMESNGTRRGTRVDWLTVSPKARATLAVNHADELKVVFPQEVDPSVYDGFESPRRYLQPMDGPDREVNTRSAIDYCLRDPRWRLSVQTHKFVGMR